MDRSPRSPSLGGWLLWLALLCGAAPTKGQVEVTPTTGSSGQVLEIDAGIELHGKPPKVWLERSAVNGGKVDKVTLKVAGDSVSGSTFEADLQHKGKLAVGLWDLRIKPKGKGWTNSNALRLEDAFEVLPPVLTGATALSAEPEQEVTFTVDQLGSKKGKLWVNGKPAKPKAWDAASGLVTVKLHKQTPPGSATVVIETKLGSSSLENVFDIPEPGGDGSGGLKINGKLLQPEAAYYDTLFEDGSWQLSVFLTQGDGNDNRALAFAAPISGFPLAGEETSVATSAQYSEGDLLGTGGKLWVLDGQSLEISFKPLDGQQIQVSIDGSLKALLNASGTASAKGTEVFKPLPFGFTGSLGLVTPGPDLTDVDTSISFWSAEGELDLWIDAVLEGPGGHLVSVLLSADTYDAHDLASGPFTFEPGDACLLVDDELSGHEFDQSFEDDGDLLITVELLDGDVPLLKVSFSGTLLADGDASWFVSGSAVSALSHL